MPATACSRSTISRSVEQGGRVRDHLRDGVEKCLTCLGNGFLSHPANDQLRRRVSPTCTGNDRITPEALYRQLLILVYRMLFLLVSEERGLLDALPLYRDHYGIGRLRRLVSMRSAADEHDDLWQSLRVLWRVLSSDQPVPSLGDRPLAAALGLPVLNGDLFFPLDLDAATLTNVDLLDAFWHLAWYQESADQPAPPRELCRPRRRGVGFRLRKLARVSSDPRCGCWRPPCVRTHPGAGRKSTGSYYTPPELVGELIKSALEPVISERLAQRPREPEKVLLSIRVCDPACGSGHFLLAAARRLGKEVARVRTAEDEPAPERVREAVRDVISHCIYGVDKNPLAVDLCRVALWLESHTADKPLTFLDHRIRRGRLARRRLRPGNAQEWHSRQGVRALGRGRQDLCPPNCARPTATSGKAAATYTPGTPRVRLLN